MEAGRPTELTDELTLKIRQRVLDGEEYKKIYESLGIPPGTWDYWVWADYQGFRENLINWKYERMVKKAEKKVEQLINADNDKVALDASTFTLETLAKKTFSKRSEITGADGKPIPILGSINVSSNDSNQENSDPKQQNQSDTRRDISQQDNLNTPDTDRPIPERQEPNTDLGSVGIISTLEKGSDAGLQENNEGTQVLE